MSRQGPPQVKVSKIESNTRITITNDGLTANNTGNSFDTVRANVKVRSGKWFYECKIESYGTVQVGWVTDEFTPSSSAGNGVGDDAHSWAYDGSRQQKWNNGSSYYGQYWSSGDVIGCALDLENKKMSFFRNGSDMGVAFENFNPSSGMYPAATVSSSQKVTFNFGKTKFAYPHPDSDFKMLHCFLTEEELGKLNKIFNEAKAVGVKLSESGETGDVIKGQGILEYAQSLGVTEDTDPGLLIVLWKLGAKSQWEVSREEFVGGWTAIGAATTDAMKAKLTQWRKDLETPDKFRRFYFWVFDYLKEEQKTILLLEEATTVWNMLKLDQQWKLWPKWAEYLEASKTKSISKDTWRQFYDFIRAHPDSLEGYDDAGSWPVLIDEFVIWHKAGGKMPDEGGDLED